MKQHITIPVHGGGTVCVPALCYGSLAVHPAITSTGYTITHIASGMALVVIYKRSFLNVIRATKRLAAFGGWREVDAIDVDDWHTKIISVKSYFPEAELIQLNNILAEVTS